MFLKVADKGDIQTSRKKTQPSIMLLSLKCHVEDQGR